MKFSYLCALSGFAYSTHALLENRAESLNSCDQQVAATNKGLIFQATAKKDCSTKVVDTTTAFVTPTPSTLIQTSVDQKSTFTTVTATSLSTHSITVTSLTTVTEHPTVTSYSTLFGNTIQSIPVPYTSVTSATTVLTITSGTPSTVTVYNPTVTVYSTAGAAQKRDLNREARSPNQAVEAFGLVLDKRVAASTASQTIPAYASACTDFAEYAAACSKAGVSRSTSTVYSTLPAVTTTSVLSVTSTSTIVVTQLFTSQVDITVIEATTGTKVQTLTDTSLKTITITQTYFSTTIVGTSTVIVASFTTVAPTTTTSITPTVTACVPAIPSGNIITNPGFNDGTFTGWNPGGNGGFSNLITNDAQCGAYRATFAVSASYSYSRIGQSFSVIDTTKRYKITTYAKFVSGNPANCMYYLSCQLPGSSSSAGNARLDTPVASIPNQWTSYTLLCPQAANMLTMSVSLQCNAGTGPVSIGLDEIYMYPV